MRLWPKLHFIFLGVVLLAVHPALADTLEEAMADYEAGKYKAALETWESLAEAGDADAMFNLGQMYRLGRGISFNFPKAEENYSHAAEAGHTAAQRELGNLYFFTIGTPGARNRAIPWWHLAAARGDPKAQYILGILYFNGDVVEKDRVQGYAWTLLAMDGGVPEALQSNTAMRGQLSEDELAQALALAQGLMTGAPNQGLYSNLIGEPLPRPRTIVASIQPPEVLEETPPVVEETLTETAMKEPAEPLILESRPIEVEDIPLELEGKANSEATTLEALEPEVEDISSGEIQDSPEIVESTEVIVEQTEPEEQAEPVYIAEEDYDLGDPDSPLVDQDGFDGAWSIQLTSFRKPENAEAHWQEVSTTHPELFALLTKKILRFDLGPERGIYYRLRIGPFLDKAEADAKCLEITEAGLGCLVIWP